MHGFTHLRDARHAYGPGGIGEVDGIPIESIASDSETVTETRALPGFVLGNVTYKSHHFWVHYASYSNTRHQDRAGGTYGGRDATVYVRIHHGGGWELWRGDYMLAMALRRYGPDDQGMFLMLWFLWEAAQAARDAGRYETAHEYQVAFVEGRLKKRKLPAQGKVKVWIEPAKPTSASAAGVPAHG